METNKELQDFLNSWEIDPFNAKKAFRIFAKACENQPSVESRFVSRPGVSYSLRFFAPKRHDGTDVIALIDVIDDDPANRWLSVCFFAHLITDPKDLGDFVPEGLEGRDALCFNLDEDNPDMINYIVDRLGEAVRS